MSKPPKQDLRKTAQQLEKAGRFGEAQKAWQSAIQAAPKDARSRLGYARFANRRSADPQVALPHVVELIKLAPKDPLTHQEAAETYCRLERFADARRHMDQAIKLGPKSADIRFVAASVENRAGQYEAAEAHIDQALALRPDHMPSQLLQAAILVSAGKMDAAQERCRALFEQVPDNIDLAQIYHRTGKMAASDPIIAHLRDSLAPKLPEQARVLRAKIQSILGKVANDEERHSDAFDHYAAAKSIDPAPYNLAAYRRHVTEISRGITRPAYLGRVGHHSEVPLLIIGMPRSGSTLLEQILSGHRDVTSAGESPALRNVAFDLKLPVHNGAAQSAVVTRLSDSQAQKLGDAYIAGLEADETSLRVVDKRLHNFELLGLFARMFPKGRVLHSMRDPMDTCVSIYMQAFRKSHAYAWKLDDLGGYYLEYRRLMDHWRRELSIPILDMPYEETVADTEAVARRAIEFAGLDWDPGCLDFRASENRSRTLSQWQVRQPIYGTSIEKWRRYDAHLGPLKARLSGLYPDGLD